MRKRYMSLILLFFLSEQKQVGVRVVITAGMKCIHPTIASSACWPCDHRIPLSRLSFVSFENRILALFFFAASEGIQLPIVSTD
jgi:hypothetical protein